MAHKSKVRRNQPQAAPNRTEPNNENTNRHVYIDQSFKVDFVKDIREQIQTAQQDTQSYAQKHFIFTVITAILTAAGFFLMSAQTSFIRDSNEISRAAMISDQRSWLKISLVEKSVNFRTVAPEAPDRIIVTPGKPMTMRMKLTNTGKRPARGIAVSVFVDILDANSEPPVIDLERESHRPVLNTFAGTIFPGESTEMLAYRVNKDGSHIPITEKEFEGLISGGAYMAVYAKATYRDTFSPNRWTKFCAWMSGGPPGSSYSAAPCVAYNSADDEE